MRKFLTILAVVAMLAVFATLTPIQAAGADVEKGVQALRDGDYASALTELKPAAEQGDAVAQNGLGVMYHNSWGVEQDFAEAVKWYQSAAEQENANAQYNLGGMYLNGYGVDRDDAEAVQWFLRAAEQGQVRAQLALGVMYATGRGVKQDDTKSYMWVYLAAEQGHDEAKQARNLSENALSPDGIQKGQDLAEQCLKNNYKDC